MVGLRHSPIEELSVSTILQCDLHDYLEIACMYRLEVELVCKDGQRLRGRPTNIKSRSGLGEFLIYENMETNSEDSIEVLELAQMTALRKNPHFDTVIFAPSS